MTQRQEIIERLRAVDLGGGSHESLSAIARAIYEPMGGWTIGACEQLRQTLVRLLGEADEEALREAYTKGREDGMGVANAKNAQAEYLRGKNDGYDEGYDAGFASADDWLSQHEDAMAEHGWYRAMDADERPVRIGAAMDSDRYEDGTVVGLQFFNTANKTPRVLIAIRPHGWDTPTWHDPEDYRHHKQPTVEDVLYDSLKHFGAVGERTPEVDSWVCEQAAKLREMLAGDAE